MFEIREKNFTKGFLAKFQNIIKKPEEEFTPREFKFSMENYCQATQLEPSDITVYFRHCVANTIDATPLIV